MTHPVVTCSEALNSSGPLAKLAPIAKVDLFNPKRVSTPGDGRCFYYAIALALLDHARSGKTTQDLNDFFAFGKLENTLNTVLNKAGNRDKGLDHLLAQQDVFDLRKQVALALKQYILHKYNSDDDYKHAAVDYIKQHIEEIFKVSHFDITTKTNEIDTRIALGGYFARSDVEAIIQSGTTNIDDIVTRMCNDSLNVEGSSVNAMLIELAMPSLDIQLWSQNTREAPGAQWTSRNMVANTAPDKGKLAVNLYRVTGDADSTHYETVLPETPATENNPLPAAISTSPSIQCLSSFFSTSHSVKEDQEVIKKDSSGFEAALVKAGKDTSISNDERMAIGLQLEEIKAYKAYQRSAH